MAGSALDPVSVSVVRFVARFPISFRYVSVLLTHPMRCPSPGCVEHTVSATVSVFRLAGLHGPWRTQSHPDRWPVEDQSAGHCGYGLRRRQARRIPATDRPARTTRTMQMRQINNRSSDMLPNCRPLRLSCSQTDNRQTVKHSDSYKPVVRSATRKPPGRNKTARQTSDSQAAEHTLQVLQPTAAELPSAPAIMQTDE